MTTPVRALVFGEAPAAERVTAELREAGWAPAVTAISNTVDAASAIASGAWDVAIAWDSGTVHAGAARDLLRSIDAAGQDVPVIVVVPGNEAGRAADLMRAGARDCVSECQLTRLAPVLERELAAAGVRRERRALEIQLQHAQRMEAVGRLASGIAHEFRNLLTAVTGYSELLIELLSPRDPLRKTAEEIRSAATRATLLSGQLLTLSRRNEPNAVVLDVNVLVSNMERMLRRLIGEHIDLAVTLAPGDARVSADRGQLEQVIMNLVVNARDAMPDGGRLSLAVGHVDVGAADGDARAGAAPGPYVSLDVQDTGHGMDERTQANLFQPFFTTKDPSKGTGLGLTMVQAVVREVGGALTVRSRVGEGTVFRILLPRVAQPVTRPARRRLQSLPRGTETILLVEDEVGVRELVRDLLARCGYTVIEAADVNDAMALFARHQDAIDLLLTDVVMPQMNGRQLAARFLAERPALRVLYMSGYTDDQVLMQDVSVSAFLQKPFTPNVLARKVREVLDGAVPTA
jgi:two-component system, cell cycle sensor histidine kinase and response regulator CckA